MWEKMWKDLAEYINFYLINGNNKKSNFENSKNSAPTLKVAEIGVGNFFYFSDYLAKQYDIETLLVDIKPQNEDVVYDNIEKPNLEIYSDIDLIYSIRPPYELVKFLIILAEKLKVSLIIKPYLNESMGNNEKLRLKNYKKAIFYQYESL